MDALSVKLLYKLKIVSEYGQEIPKSQTAESAEKP